MTLQGARVSLLQWANLFVKCNLSVIISLHFVSKIRESLPIQSCSHEDTVNSLIII